MAELTRSKASRRLLTTLLDNPDLPTFVRQMPAPVLTRLIDHVGLHDAGELVALAGAEQLRDVFESSLWQNLIPGQADTPAPRRIHSLARSVARSKPRIGG